MAESKPSTKVAGKGDAVIRKCGCEPEKYPAWKFQEDKYGKGMRVMNPNAKGFSCTICSKQYTT